MNEPWLHACIRMTGAGLWTKAAYAALAGCTLASCTSVAQPVEAGRKGLLIQGYNYTNQYINSFTVNGAGGGNVFVSSPTNGGGKATCCYDLPSAVASAQVKVRWSAAYCMERKENPYSFGPRIVEERKTFWREVSVPITDVQQPAKALEVHFYPDGHVEVAVTPGYSPPRLKLPVTSDDQRPGAPHPHPPCSHEQS